MKSMITYKVFIDKSKYGNRITSIKKYKTLKTAKRTLRNVELSGHSGYISRYKKGNRFGVMGSSRSRWSKYN